uniref:uncharacterized protein n=1 Tax=Myxine glutinosa TaxID=7769 RepID=UPI00358FE108
MSPPIVCNQCATRSPQLSLMTWKVVGITVSVISVLLATCIFWEMRSNQKHQPEICLQTLDQMVAKKHFLFSTDSYHPGSIKAQERLRRGSSEKIILAGPATRKPYDLKMFLANYDNKKQLCQLLLRVWSGQQAASRLERTEMAVLIVEGRAHQFVSMNGEVEVRELPTIYSNQEETDTRVVLYLHHAAALGYKNAVVRTPDTYLRDSSLPRSCHQADCTWIPDQGNIDN